MLSLYLYNDGFDILHILFNCGAYFMIKQTIPAQIGLDSLFSNSLLSFPGVCWTFPEMQPLIINTLHTNQPHRRTCMNRKVTSASCTFLKKKHLNLFG